jgi:hypothetical protein
VFDDHLPLPYPLETTRDQQGFRAWYPLVFTPQVLQAIRKDHGIIAADHAKIWMNWRGAMFGDGYLWITPILVGKPPHQQRRLEVNIGNFGHFFKDRQALEEKRREAVRNLKEGGLHPSLADFDQPFCDGSTPTWRFRMDTLPSKQADRHQDDRGPSHYRLAIWPKDTTWRDAPRWVLTLVRRELPGGSMGPDIWYLIEERGFYGEVDIDGMGEGDALGRLVVHSTDKVLIDQPVQDLHR